ncbi:hypothetical protein L598_000700001210 [Mesorhizobium sp. J18]|uniref:hypothetical protein n=1 Tax=Mesorhizobium sp. J18 TaxID=935263 RepID=UPI0011990E59|nr:hypothetical protein [Mesorhizobium sp. J18]TWG90364.1 hypothetical protein L598_000700001210 [Mesorhizobium sp. J18]
MLARVSNIEAFRRWRENEDQTVEELVRFITTDEPSEAMKAGTAFHKALETADDGEYSLLEANGYIFRLPDAVLSLPITRELRGYRQYGGLTVTGQCDGIVGKTVIDHKTTGRCDPERYLGGCQWKFYLEIFEADFFVWNIFEIKEIGEKEYTVAPPQVLTAYRYPEMRDDCERLAADYLEFANQFLQEAA